jgi:hypothetical protein
VEGEPGRADHRGRGNLRLHHRALGGQHVRRGACAGGRGRVPRLQRGLLLGLHRRPPARSGDAARPVGGGGNAGPRPGIRLFPDGASVGGRPPRAAVHPDLRERCPPAWTGMAG